MHVQIRENGTKALKGIGRSGTVLGQERIQIPVSSLNMTIYVDSSILDDNAPSLLSNRDMIENSLEICLQGRYLYVGKHRQPLTQENYFFVYRWTAEDTFFALYTEKIMRRIQRDFGHPSVQDTHNLLKRASNGKMKVEIKKEL